METAVGGNGDVRSTKTGDGGEDVYSSQESNVFSADHLVVLVHGILGRYLLLGGIMCFSGFNAVVGKIGLLVFCLTVILFFE